jgi:hypothetical protein
MTLNKIKGETGEMLNKMRITPPSSFCPYTIFVRFRTIRMNKNCKKTVDDFKLFFD